VIGAHEIRRAAELIRAGRLVAFPTETVYGLGANALDAAAVERIYEAKGRPAESPLIVHAASITMARELAAEWPRQAEVLAERYWPGPLTLVLPKKRSVPDIVTAGLSTVGIRIPAHPVALALIREAGVPIAAPSANRFTGLSPTTAAHVRDGLGAAVDLILDGGPTNVGIESTVLSLAGAHPVLLRPGMVSQAEIEELVGPVEMHTHNGPGAHASPGLHPRHYSPRTRLLLVEGGAVPNEGRGAYLGLSSEPARPVACFVPMPAQAADYAARLYETLHRLDREGLDWIAVERPPNHPGWAGILDRLERAGEPRQEGVTKSGDIPKG
jgi:L-threonylcarbamoyladenylate synthase